MRAWVQRLVNCPNCTAVAVSALLVAAIVVAFVLDLQARYHSAIENAQRSARSFAEVLAEHTARTFEAVDRTLRQAELLRQSHPAGDSASRELASKALRHLQQSSPVLKGIIWTNAAGDIQAQTNPALARKDLVGLPHFTIH